MIVAKPFRIIVEQIQGFWTVFRTDANAKPKYYSKCLQFEQACELVEFILANNMLCRQCEKCNKPYLPRKLNQRICNTHLQNFNFLKQNKALLDEEILLINQGENTNEIHDQRPNNPPIGQREQAEPKTSRIRFEFVDGIDSVRNEQQRAVRTPECGTLQEANPSRQERNQPANGTDAILLGQGSHQVSSSESTSRPNSEQIKPLRAKYLNADQLKGEIPPGQKGNYRCRYCGLMKYYDGFPPFPVFCPPCAREREEDKQRSANAQPTKKAYEKFKAGCHNTNVI